MAEVDQAARAQQRRAAVRVVGTTLRGFLELAVVGAVAWVVWWTPPKGTAFEGQFSYVLEQVEGSVSGTATYLVVAGVAGLVGGLVAAVVHRAYPWLTLATVAGAGLLAGWVLAALGRALGPEDASSVAERSADGSTVLLDLRIEGWGAYAAMPAGALLGVAIVFLLWPTPAATAKAPAERPAQVPAQVPAHVPAEPPAEPRG